MARTSRPPPGRSLWDGSAPAQTSESNKVKDSPVAQNVEVVGRALKEMNSIARSDHQRIDLKDLLLNSSREAQYGELPAGVRHHSSPVSAKR